MPAPPLILGEFSRTLDDRYRLSLPGELAEAFGESGDSILAKERRGCLSLWDASVWQARLEANLELVRQKIGAGKLDNRLGQVQMLGRLLSTRHKPVRLTNRSRLVIPEGFREFLAVEPGGEVMLVGAAVCVEIWSPTAWLAYLQRRMPRFRRLFDELAG